MQHQAAARQLGSKYGPEFRLVEPEAWGDPDTATVQVTERCGLARTMAWDHVRQAGAIIDLDRPQR
ncbi:hypothetical protein [Streptomyces sp. BK340]|uniref:hypothetical protein n=1 Tax=Streptomyces sp. BK340 TaxID=2572903 RepID=UPI00119F223C|nr:hypothetical protein [Streptomyces sp. BK340]